MISTIVRRLSLEVFQTELPFPLRVTLFGFEFRKELTDLEVLCEEFGRFRRGTLQCVNAEFGRKLISDRAARQPTRQDDPGGCIACLVENALKRDPSLQLISAEIIEDEEAEDPRGFRDELERKDAQFDSERQFEEFVSEEE